MFVLRIWLWKQKNVKITVQNVTALILNGVITTTAIRPKEQFAMNAIVHSLNATNTLKLSSYIVTNILSVFEFMLRELIMKAKWFLVKGSDAIGQIRQTMIYAYSKADAMRRVGRMTGGRNIGRAYYATNKNELGDSY